MKRGLHVSVIIYIMMLIIALFALIPFLWTILSSFKFDADVFRASFFPENPTLRNYVAVFTDARLMQFFLNTVQISFFSTIASIVVAVLGAYGFSRYKFPGRNVLLYSILFTRVLPRVTLLIPFFVILTRLNLINTISGLVLVYLIIGMPVSIWLLKGYIDNIPYEIEEAALIDGCGPFRTLTQVVIPIIAPAVAAIGMFAFILSWNEFLFPRVLTTVPDVRPISVGLAFLYSDVNVRWGMLMAASVVMSVPAIFAFGFAQKYIVKGLSEGAVKG